MSYWKIVNNQHTKAKMLALKKMLDFDSGGQFKTLFNSLTPSTDMHLIDVSGLDDIADQGDVLDLMVESWWDIDDVLGMGLLHTVDPTTMSTRMFCGNTVCSPS